MPAGTLGAPPPGAAAYLGGAFEAVRSFGELLAEHGVERGLIGPGEVGRLWERHLLNSAAVVEVVRSGDRRSASGGPVRIADVGSGAGLPGVVVALLMPEAKVHLIETMQRRCAWLEQVVGQLALHSTQVHCRRAEELIGSVEVDVVTARAVAPLGRLVGWTAGLLRPGGRWVLLKGSRVADEIAEAGSALQKARVDVVGIHEVDPGGVGEPTRVLELVRR